MNLRSLLALALACGPAASKSPIVVPIEVRKDLALVHVSVNGKEGLLILDSGAGALVLDSAFAASANIRFDDHMRGNANGRTPVRIGKADRVEIGGAALTNVMTVATSFRDVQDRVGSDVQGAVGYELFREYVVDLDFDARTVTLIEPASFHYAGSGARIPIHLERNLPVVAATVMTRSSGAIPLNLHVDLGSATFPIRLSRRFLAQHPIESDTTSRDVVLGAGVGGIDKGRLMILPSLRVGSLTIDRPETVLSVEQTGTFGFTAPTDGTIGAKVFRHARIIFDYSRAEIIVEPHEGFGKS